MLHIPNTFLDVLSNLPRKGAFWQHHSVRTYVCMSLSAYPSDGLNSKIFEAVSANFADIMRIPGRPFML